MNHALHSGSVHLHGDEQTISGDWVPMSNLLFILTL